MASAIMGVSAAPALPSCAPPPSLEEAFADADLLFIGVTLVGVGLSRDGLPSPFGRADQRCRSCGTANKAMSFYYRRRLTCAYVRGRAATRIQNSPRQHGIMPCRPRRCGVT